MSDVLKARCCNCDAEIDYSPELADDDCEQMTLAASTPNGGRHLYCRFSEGIRNRVFTWGEVRATDFT